MKYIFLLLLIPGILGATFWDHVRPAQFNFGFDADANSDGEVFDYSIAAYTYGSNIETYTEYSRLYNKFTTNHDFRIFHNWKHFGLRGTWQRFQGFDINNYQVAAYGIYKGWYSGVLQGWDVGVPSTNFYLGKEYALSVNFFLAPFDIIMRQEFLSPDFVNWYYETHFRMEIETQSKIIDNVAGLFDVDINTGRFILFVSYTAKDYGQVYWSIHIGGGYKF